MKASSFSKFYPLVLFVILTVIYESHSPLAQSTSSSVSSTGDNVWVMQPDGGKSCDAKSGNSLEQGATSLKKAQIAVLDSHKESDGLKRAQVCGISSGTSNVYQIHKSDLPKAMTLGFEQAK